MIVNAIVEFGFKDSIKLLEYYQEKEGHVPESLNDFCHYLDLSLSSGFPYDEGSKIFIGMTLEMVNDLTEIVKSEPEKFPGKEKAREFLGRLLMAKKSFNNAA